MCRSRYLDHTSIPDNLPFSLIRPEPENPLGLFGVIFATLWIIAFAIALHLKHQHVLWFLVLQLLSFVGQGASAAAKEYMGFISNLFEQVSHEKPAEHLSVSSR